MRSKKPCSAIIFYIAIFLFFFLDLAAFSFFEKPLLYSLLCFYLLQLSRPIPISRIIISCLLFCLSSLILYDRFGLSLIYVIPATLLGIKMRHILYNSSWQYYLLLALCLLVQIGLVEHLILHWSVSIPYTISTLFVNLMVIGTMSLVLKIADRRFSRKKE